MTKNRSLWKGPFVNNFFLNFNLIKKIKIIKTSSRNTTILPYMIGKKIKVHNGKDFYRLNITENMVGHKLGEFSLTRTRHIYKSKRKKKKR